MARQTITRKRVKKYGEGTGYEKCRMCGGSGRQKTPKKKKA